MTISRIEVGKTTTGSTTQVVATLYSTNTDRRHDLSIYNAEPALANVPIIVLLHGVYGSHWVWQTLGKADAVYESLRLQGLGEFVLVMPSDGGIAEGSAYLPLKNGEDYEAWIMQDVMTATLTLVANATQASPVFLCGLSMGGFGALRLGCKYAKNIAGISAHSAVTSVSDLNAFTQVSTERYPVDSEQSSILYWAQKNHACLPPIRFDCGAEDCLLDANIRLSHALTQRSIEHQYDTFTGGHEWPYWQAHLADSLRFFDNIVKEKQDAEK